MTTFYCLNPEGQVAVFFSPWHRMAQLSPRHWVPFSSPTTRRAMVGVFKPASTWHIAWLLGWVTYQLEVYRQLVRLGAEPLETRGQNFFSELNTCGYSPYITSLMRGLVCHLQLLLALTSVFILGYESRGSCDHILLSQIRDFLSVASYGSPPQNSAHLYRRGTDQTQKTQLLYLLRGFFWSVLVFPRDRYPVSPLVRRLLRSNDRSTDLSEHRSCCCVFVWTSLLSRCLATDFSESIT
jgi:hypothetical protein